MKMAETGYFVVPPETIRVLTLNVDCLPFPLTKDGEYRISEMCDQIVSEGIDIVCFQECFDKQVQKIVSEKFMGTHPYQLLHQRYNAHGVIDWLNWLEDSGLVVLSRYQITGSKFIPFEHIEGIDSLCWKGVLGFSVRVSEEHSLMVFTTHLISNDQWKGSRDESGVRREELTEIINFMIEEEILNSDENNKDHGNTIICGDFNFAEGSKEYENFMNSKMIDVWRTVFPDKETNPGYTWDGVRNKNMIHGNHRARIDYFFDAWKNTEFKKEGCRLFIPGKEPYECLSDHFGVVCEIVVSSLKRSDLRMIDYDNVGPGFLSRILLRHHPFI